MRVGDKRSFIAYKRTIKLIDKFENDWIYSFILNDKIMSGIADGTWIEHCTEPMEDEW